jgi:cyclase
MALAKRIIPCLDVTNGRVVKGVNFVNLRDMGDPVELAQGYQADGADELVFLDITASSDKRQTALAMVQQVAQHLAIPFTLGGGLRCLADIYDFLAAGADKVALNTSAINNPQLIDQSAQQFGSQCVVVAIDAKQDAQGNYQVYTHGGRQQTNQEVISWAQQVVERGAGEILLTSMDRDGTGLGYDNALTGKLARLLPVPVIASGGADSPQHLYEALAAGADAVLAATIFHSGSHSIGKVKNYLASKGIIVRPAE